VIKVGVTIKEVQLCY